MTLKRTASMVVCVTENKPSQPTRVSELQPQEKYVLGEQPLEVKKKFQSQKKYFSVEQPLEVKKKFHSQENWVFRTEDGPTQCIHVYMWT